jgi:GNAT superfamily N-acetyltransferase
MMDVTELPKKPRGTPAHVELPILFLGQVAVSRPVQGRGIGSILMHHVFEKASRISQEAGCFALVLDVMDDGGEAAFARRCAWYRDFGFQDFASRAGRMFMTMKQVRAIIQDPVV